MSVDPRCGPCPVAPGSPCHGPCSWAASGDPFLMKSVVDRAKMPAPGEAPPPSALPTLSARAATFAVAVARHVAAGMPVLSDEATAARLAVCGACPERLANGVCASCGCHLAPKARMATEDCPKGKWPK